MPGAGGYYYDAQGNPLANPGAPNPNAPGGVTGYYGVGLGNFSNPAAFGYNGNTWIPGGSGESGGDVGSVDPAFAAWVQQQGYQPVGWGDGTGNWQGFLDRSGNLVHGSADNYANYNDSNYWTGALLAGSLVGGAAAGFGSGAGASAGLSDTGLAAGYDAGLTGVGSNVGASAAGAGAGAAGAGGAAAGGGAAGAGASLGGGSAASAGAGSGGGFLSSLFGGSGAGLSNGQLLAAQLASGLGSTYLQGQASQNAANIQGQYAQAGQNQLQQSQAAIMASLAPFLGTGLQGLNGQATLAGLNGTQQQQSAIDALKASPQFTSAQQLGENRILANASATGGLRGGNTQAALAQFSPALLSATINDQYSRLGGLTGLGFNATQTGAGVQQSTGNNVANLLQQQGAAGAGGALAAGRTNSGYLGVLSNVLGLYGGLNSGAQQQQQVPQISGQFGGQYTGYGSNYGSNSLTGAGLMTGGF